MHPRCKRFLLAFLKLSRSRALFSRRETETRIIVLERCTLGRRKSKVEAHERKGRKAEAAFADFRRRRRTSQSAARNVHGGRQWRAIAYISLASRCSRLLITQGSGLGTRVINGSGPRLGYRGTKLRANLPQPYINPDFLSLLSQRSPSLLPAPPSPCRIPTARYNEKACVLSCPDYSSPSLAPNKIVY